MKVSAERIPAKSKRIIIIGTGPVSLLKAYFLAKADSSNSITLIDSAAQIGGAWYSDKSPKGYEIECGCHIWSYVPSAYRFVEKELGIILFPMKPNAVFIGKRLRVPYSIKNSVDSYKALLKITFGLKWRWFKKLGSNPDINFRLIGKKNKYPKTGSQELIQALEQKIKSLSNITILLNTTIKSIAVEDEIQVIVGEKKLSFDKLYMTYVSQINELKINQKTIPITTHKVDYIHFLVRLDRPLKKKISYWRLMNDPIVHRITDISYQTKFEEQLILVGIKDSVYYNQDETQLSNHVRQMMTKFGLLDNTYQFERIKTHIFPTYYIADESLELLKKHKNKIELIRTTDLMHGLHFLLEGEK